MNSITFTIDRAEVEKIACKKLTPKIVEEVFTLVENDMVLWDDIKEAITSAVRFLDEK